MLSEEEKFRFDLQGYLVIRGVLSKTECSALAELSYSVWPRQAADGGAASAEWHTVLLVGLTCIMS